MPILTNPPWSLAELLTPYTVAPGIDTVAVPDFDNGLQGHAYFAQAEALLQRGASAAAADHASGA